MLKALDILYSIKEDYNVRFLEDSINEAIKELEDLQAKENAIAKRIIAGDFMSDEQMDNIIRQKEIRDSKKNLEEIKNMKNKVLEWAKQKGILDNATAEKQFLKTIEEIGEVSSALAKNNLDELEDGIGDVAVTLIILAELKGLDFDKCLERAYNVISKRTGKMQNGIFVKDN